MNKKVDYIAGIDTLEITSATFTEQEFDFFTHDTSRIVQRNALAEPKYKYRINPDKTLYDTSTIDGYWGIVIMPFLLGTAKIPMLSRRTILLHLSGFFLVDTSGV